ncbi:DUF6932 family protein [Chryseobacterium taklimakanense]|uniref:Uncharacterized protein n=1 Tax=Chryseobacterium taklimakanense TaxID=536441 RepID=A0A3G8WVP4_9FLAO|nr:hypothetical protein [Chryseobacterium taklimakanense]AZI20441.1 hypothetical protein EIH08_06705 [Chryseobacterium taklimakanense]
MGRFTFDKNGNIIPYDLHQISISELEEEFVNPFPNSTTRKDIYDGHSNYIIELVNVLESNFSQWLDGSFVTKKLNPNDIDVVNFVHFSEVTNDKHLLLQRFLTGVGNPQDEFKVDGYLVPVYDSADPRYAFTQDRYNYWRTLLGRDRESKPKGLLHLNIIQDGN